MIITGNMNPYGPADPEQVKAQEEAVRRSQATTSQASGQQFENSSPNSGPAHLDALLDGPGAGESFDQAAAPSPARLTRDEFATAFRGGFQAAHEFSGLKSLDVSDKEDRARACAFALYDTILDIPSLHWILDPRGKWAGRAFAIGMFVVPVGASVARELREQKRGQAPQQGPLNYTAAKASAKPPSDGEPTAEQANALNFGKVVQ